LPGQYLDVHIPNISQAGGFTITSPPSTTAVLPSAPSEGSPKPPEIPDPYVELAIQKSDNNPPAAYFWQPVDRILNAPLQIRVGGAFVYPPPFYTLEEASRIDRVVFVAGGVGINPIISMLSAMALRAPGWVGGMVRNVRVLYSTRRKDDENVLFEDRLSSMANKYQAGHAGDKLTEVNFEFTLFETSGRRGKNKQANAEATKREYRRITHNDLKAALGPENDRANTVVYVCGPPEWTDDTLRFLQKSPGMDEKRVLCEKWW
jgi:ferredoxin-NADP reductase